ncbi:hypothetical protein CBR_g34274 [Chara braunii]|uniref:Reverse transcriptase domain-containing protein n=1 Tax=Chara braunii TaxID=69332 RepID=A0A388JYQ5_CHABU|nr:hypothetical protein CBR_g34274 [Chara braunii]|eukprot:GBG62902.1 hypothetical protein CBR_g34274 [Chara braunii]
MSILYRPSLYDIIDSVEKDTESINLSHLRDSGEDRERRVDTDNMADADGETEGVSDEASGGSGGASGGSWLTAFEPILGKRKRAATNAREASVRAVTGAMRDHTTALTRSDRECLKMQCDATRDVARQQAKVATQLEQQDIAACERVATIVGDRVKSGYTCLADAILRMGSRRRSHSSNEHHSSDSEELSGPVKVLWPSENEIADIETIVHTADDVGADLAEVKASFYVTTTTIMSDGRSHAMLDPSLTSLPAVMWGDARSDDEQGGLDRGGLHMSRVVQWTQDVARQVAEEVCALPADVAHYIVQRVQARCAHMLEPAHAATHLLCPSRRGLRYFEGVVSNYDASLVREAETYILSLTGFSVASPEYETACNVFGTRAATLHPYPRDDSDSEGHDDEDEQAGRATATHATYEHDEWSDPEDVRIRGGGDDLFVGVDLEESGGRHGSPLERQRPTSTGSRSAERERDPGSVPSRGAESGIGGGAPGHRPAHVRSGTVGSSTSLPTSMEQLHRHPARDGRLHRLVRGPRQRLEDRLAGGPSPVQGNEGDKQGLAGGDGGALAGGGGGAEVAAAVEAHKIRSGGDEGIPTGGGGGFSEFGDVGMPPGESVGLPRGESESCGDISVGMQDLLGQISFLDPTSFSPAMRVEVMSGAEGDEDRTLPGETFAERLDRLDSRRAGQMAQRDPRMQELARLAAEDRQRQLGTFTPASLDAAPGAHTDPPAKVHDTTQREAALDEASSMGVDVRQGTHESGLAPPEEPRSEPVQPPAILLRPEETLHEVADVPLPTGLVEGAVQMSPSLEDIHPSIPSGGSFAAPSGGAAGPSSPATVAPMEGGSLTPRSVARRGRDTIERVRALLDTMSFGRTDRPWSETRRVTTTSVGRQPGLRGVSTSVRRRDVAASGFGGRGGGGGGSGGDDDSRREGAGGAAASAVDPPLMYGSREASIILQEPDVVTRPRQVRLVPLDRRQEGETSGTDGLPMACESRRRVDLAAAGTGTFHHILRQPDAELYIVNITDLLVCNSMHQNAELVELDPPLPEPPEPPDPSAPSTPPTPATSSHLLASSSTEAPSVPIPILTPSTPASDAAAAEEFDNLLSTLQPSVAALLREYRDVFPPTVSYSSIPPMRDIEHHIRLEPNYRIQHRAPYRLSVPEAQELKRQIDELLRQGFIKPSTSPCSAPVLFDRKKDGTLRLCLDYRGLNEYTVRNSYPMPRADDLFDRLSGHHFFTMIDLRSGYHQIRVAEEDQPKTAFRSRFGHYEFTVMPFGLRNAPTTFQTAMNTMFQDLLEDSVLVYIDDILVYSRILEEHLTYLRTVLQRLRDHGFYAKLSKCHFAQPKVDFLGHQVSEHGFHMDDSKIQAIVDWPTPTSLPALRSFPGLTNYYGHFLKNYAQYSSKLTPLTRGRLPFYWTPTHENAFRSLKRLVTSAPVLHLPDYSRPFIVTTDASDFATGVVLSQMYPAPSTSPDSTESRLPRIPRFPPPPPATVAHLAPIEPTPPGAPPPYIPDVADDGTVESRGGESPVAYLSRQLLPAERNYTVDEREVLALVYAVKKWRYHLHGHTFTVLTDNSVLAAFQTKPKLTSRQARWWCDLSEFDFTIRKIFGESNRVADALSRRLDLHCEDRQLSAISAPTIHPAFLDEYRRAYTQCPEFQSIYADLQAGKAENILNLELDMPDRTTYDFEGAVGNPRIQAALDQAFADDSEMVFAAGDRMPNVYFTYEEGESAEKRKSSRGDKSGKRPVTAKRRADSRPRSSATVS